LGHNDGVEEAQSVNDEEVLEGSDCLSFAAAGMVLMVLTLAWRINPVEGSVVPRFLTSNPLGIALFYVLFATCMPALIAGTVLTARLVDESAPAWLFAWLPQWFYPSFLLVLPLQAVAYFLFGKLVRCCASRMLSSKNQ